MQPKTIRTFIAIDLPDEVKAYLTAVSKELSRQLPKGAVRWVKPEQMHLTLRFLGDTAVSQLNLLYDTLDTNLAEAKPFTLKLSQLGAFPNKERPRVIWVGIGGEMKALNLTQSQVVQAVTSLNFPPDKLKFKPHLTLGRVKNLDGFKNKKWGGRVESLAFGVTAVHLIQSELNQSGPIYKTLHSINLT